MARVESLPAVRRTAFCLNDASPYSLAERDNSPTGFDISECWESEVGCNFLHNELKLNDCETVLEKSLREISEDNCVPYNPRNLNVNDETNIIQLSQKTDGVAENPENRIQELGLDTSASMAPITNTFYKSDPLDISSSEFRDNDFKLQSLAESSSNHGSKFLNGESNLISSLSEGKNDSSVTVKEVDNLSSLLDSCKLSSCNVDSTLLNRESYLLDSISEKEMNDLLVCKSPVMAKEEISLGFPNSSVALLSNPDSRPLNGELDVLDLLLSEDKNYFHVPSGVAKDIDILSSFEDASGILSSSTMSLANLADNHFFNNEPIKNINGMDKCSISNSKNNPNSFLFDSFDKIQSNEKSEAEFNTEEFLNKSNNEATKDFVHIQQFKGNMGKNEVPEDEIELDIDLNFCVTSPDTKDNYFAESSNSESKDSGFDETDLETIKSIIPSFQVSTSGEKQKIETSKNVLEKERPSLLSIAISCELNLEKSRKEKLKRVKELLKHSFLGAFSNFKFEDDSEIVAISGNNSVKNICSGEEDIADYSDDCEELKNHMVFLGQ